MCALVGLGYGEKQLTLASPAILSEEFARKFD